MPETNSTCGVEFVVKLIVKCILYSCYSLEKMHVSKWGHRSCSWKKVRRASEAIL